MKTVALEVSQWWQCFSINGLGVIAKHVQTLHVLKQQKYKNKNNNHTITKANLDLAKTAGYKIQTYTKWWIWVVNNLSRKDPTLRAPSKTMQFQQALLNPEGPDMS